MAEPAKEPRISWGSRDFVRNIRAAAASEDRPLLAQLMNRLAELAEVRGLWTESALKHLYALAGCMLALDRPADALGAAELLQSKQAARVRWGETHQPNVLAVRAQASEMLADTEAASQARLRISAPRPASPEEITDRWNETLRFYRADLARAQELPDGLARLLEAGEIQAHVVRSLVTAPPEFAEKVGLVYAEAKAVVNRLVSGEAVAPSRLAPVTPPRRGAPALPQAFQVRPGDPSLVRQYKEHVLARPGFAGQAQVFRIIDLTWMLYALDRVDEAAEVIEAVLDDHRGDEKFLDSEEGILAVSVAALLHKERGGPRFEEYRAFLQRLRENVEQTLRRNQQVSPDAPDPELELRRVLEEVVPRNLEEARVEPRRDRAFGLLRASLDKAAQALARESYGRLSPATVRGYLATGRELILERIRNAR